MPTLKLTDRTIRGLTAAEGARYTEYMDESLRGFGLMAWATGAKTFFVRYSAQGKRKREKLGKYPAVRLADARAQARRILAGVDTKHGSPMLVNELCDLYLEMHARPKKKPVCAREDERMLAKDVRPLLGSQRVIDITVGDCAKLLDGIAVRGPTTANRTRALGSKAWNFAISRGITTWNPFQATERPGKEQPRDRHLSWDEIAALWPIWAADQTINGAMYRLMLLTGQRSGEVKGMAWAEVEGDLWTIPAERMGKTKRPHVIPLVGEALRIVEGLRVVTSRFSAYAFPSPSRSGEDGHRKTLTKATKRYVRASGVDNWSPHTLRHTARTRLAELGVPPHVCNAIFAHTQPGMGGRYNHYAYLPEMREALALWDARLMKLVR